MKKLSLCLLAGLLVVSACSKKEKKEAAPVTTTATTEVKTEAPVAPVQPMVVEPEAGKATTERQSGAVQPGMPEAKAEIK